MHLDAEAFTALFAGQTVETLQHLLTCARCRRRLSGILFDLDLPAEEPGKAEAATTTMAAPNSLRAQERAREILLVAIERLVTEERRPRTLPEARQLVDGLLRLPPEVRLEAIEGQPRYRTGEMAEVLLAEAKRSVDPTISRHLAQLAGAILGFQPSSARRQRVDALVSCLLADAERRMGRLDIAEDIFRNAADALRDQPLILEERVVLCRTLAALRQDQGRVDEALGLLEHASMVSEELGSFHELALARLAYGWLLLEEYDSERAILPLREALSLTGFDQPRVDPSATPFSDEDPQPAFSALHALALAYAELGEDELVAQTFEALDRVANFLPDPLDRIRIRWIHARAEVRRNQYEEALPELQGVFDALLRLGPGFEAALAALDLARITAEHALDDPDYPAGLEHLSRELFSLPPDRLAPHLVFALRFALEFPKRRKGALLDVLLSASAYVERARFNPDYAYYPTPEPERIMVWRDLSRSQRLQAAIAAGVQLGPDNYPKSAEDHLLISWTHEALTGVRMQLPFGLEDETRD